MTLLSVYFNDWINKLHPITNQHIVIIIVCKPSLVTFLRRFLLFVCSQCKSLCLYGSSDLHFLFFALTYTPFLPAVSLFPNSYKPVGAILHTYLSRICTFPTWSFWWNFCKSCAFGFSIFCLVSFHYCCIYFLFACHFSSQTRIRENR